MKILKSLSVVLAAVLVMGLAFSIAACDTENYTPDEYTITYNLDGGTNHADNPTTFLPTEPPTIKPASDKTGFIFEGWTSEELEMTEPETTFTIPLGTVKDVTLDANYVEIQVVADGYSITYIRNNGINHPDNPDSFDPEAGDLPLEILEATREDYDFLGWTCPQLGITTPQTTVEITEDPEADLVFTAHWEAKPIVPVEEPANYGANKRKAPDLKLFDLNGKEYNLSDYKGLKPVLITIWKYNCPGCKEEMRKYFAPVYNEMSAKFEILAVHIDARNKLVDHLKSNPYPFPVLNDESLRMYQTPYHTGYTPTNYMVDRFGYLYKDGVSSNNVGDYYNGEITSSDELKTWINGAISRAAID